MNSQNKLWFFNWQNGGYNYVMAKNKEDAIKQAKLIWSKGIVDQSTLISGDKARIKLQLAERAYRGMFD